MVVNLITNVHQGLEGFPVATPVHCCLDSSVAFYRIKDQGEYRQFVANCIPNVRWHHVPKNENPADLGSRGGSVREAELWWKGHDWFPDPAQWPPEILSEPSAESTAERKFQRELFALDVEGRVLHQKELRRLPSALPMTSRNFTFNQMITTFRCVEVATRVSIRCNYPTRPILRERSLSIHTCPRAMGELCRASKDWSRKW